MWIIREILQWDNQVQVNYTTDIRVNQSLLSFGTIGIDFYYQSLNFKNKELVNPIYLTVMFQREEETFQYPT